MTEEERAAEPRLSKGYTIWICVLAWLGLMGVVALWYVATVIARQEGGAPTAMALPAMVWAYTFVVTTPLAVLRLRRWRHAASATFVHALVMLPLTCLAVPGLAWIFTGLKREREWQRRGLQEAPGLVDEPEQL